MAQVSLCLCLQHSGLLPLAFYFDTLLKNLRHSIVFPKTINLKFFLRWGERWEGGGAGGGGVTTLSMVILNQIII